MKYFARINICMLLYLGLGNMFLYGQIQARGIDRHSVYLYEASSPLYSTTLERVIPLVQSRTDLAPILKHSVLLKNNSHHTIVAYALQWSVTMADGTKRTHTQSFSEPSALTQRKSAAGDFRIAPSEYRVIAPEANWSDRDLALLSHSSSTLRPMADSFVANLDTSNKVLVSLDGVFFGDGTFVGDDTSLFFEAFEEQENARRDIASLVKAAIDTRTADGILEQELSTLVDQGKDVGPGANNVGDIRRAARSAEARDYLLLLRTHRKDVLIAQSRYAATDPKLSLRKIP